jgi:hypothetical protein
MAYTVANASYHRVATQGWVQPFFIWTVMKWTSASWASNQYVFDGVTLNTDAFIWSGTTAVETYAGTAVQAWSAASPKTFQAWGVYFAGAASYIASNGTIEASGTNTGTSPPGGLTIGGPGDLASAAWSDAQVADIIVYTSLPSAGELSRLAAYRLARYGF